MNLGNTCFFNSVMQVSVLGVLYSEHTHTVNLCC